MPNMRYIPPNKSKDLDAIVWSLSNGFCFEDKDSHLRIMKTPYGYVRTSKSSDCSRTSIDFLPDVRNTEEAYGRFIAEVYEHLSQEIGMDKASAFIAEYCNSKKLLD